MKNLVLFFILQMASNKFVTLTEITRQVLKLITAKNESQTETVVITPQQVQSVFKCIGYFVSNIFKKTNFDQVIADVYSIGSFIRYTKTSQSDFIPSHLM